MNRKQVPANVETAVLLKSARRCALCFHLSRDLSEKIGQIAHLDKDPSNSADDNLAFMCLHHHSLFDSSTSQHKNYTLPEVKSARASLYEVVARGEHAAAVLAVATVPENIDANSVPSDARSVEEVPRSSTSLMPLVREATIPAKAVPINLGPGPLMPPLPYLGSAKLASFYGLLQDLAREAFEPLPHFVGLPESDRPTDERGGAHFLVELFQYVLFRSMDLLQHSSIEHVTRSHRTATVPPEAVVYPPEEVAAAVHANRFSAIGQEPTLWTSGWQVRVPRGSRILFSQHDGDSLIAPTSVIEFSNPSLYVLRVSAYVGVTYNYPTDAGVATDKGAFVAMAYEVTIKCHFEFMRRPDTDRFQQQEYERWAVELFGGLEQMIAG
jgi:hypothetical protein